MDFLEFTRLKHSSHFEDVSAFGNNLTQSWLRTDTADYWRHARMYEPAEILNSKHDGSWLTIGDGRWGLDSIRLKNLGIKKVLCTDIAETFLAKSLQQGLIENYRIEDAENLTLNDDSFDFVFCKESLHHFPRPYLAVYEMLRVAKKAVILVEPNDPILIVSANKNSIKKYFRKLSLKLDNILKFKNNWLSWKEITSFQYNDPAWEPSGNYTYSFSKRDLQKVAYGLNLPGYAFKGLNDSYVEGCEFEIADASISRIFLRIQAEIDRKNQLCSEGLAQPDLIMHVIFLDENLLNSCENTFIKSGFTLERLKANPYYSAN